MGNKKKYGNPMKQKAFKESLKKETTSLNSSVKVDMNDHINDWEEYKQMADDVYYNQKRRTKKLDEIHEILNHVGDEVEAKVPGQGDAFVEHLCQQMKKIVFLSWDTNKNQNFITGVEQSEQSKDALSFSRFKGFSDKHMEDILNVLVSMSFFEPEDVYHYLD